MAPRRRLQTESPPIAGADVPASDDLTLPERRQGGLVLPPVPSLESDPNDIPVAWEVSLEHELPMLPEMRAG